MGVVGFFAETGRMASGNSNKVLRNKIFAVRTFFDQQKQSLPHNQIGCKTPGRGTRAALRKHRPD